LNERKITTHHTNDCNRQIELTAHRPSTGGAPVRYDISGPRHDVPGVGSVPSFGVNLKFQDGPIADGVNGLTNEVLLAILEDRLRNFQQGPFACPENDQALTHIRSAQAALRSRTITRQGRGVEGTHTP